MSILCDLRVANPAVENLSVSAGFLGPFGAMVVLIFVRGNARASYATRLPHAAQYRPDRNIV